MVNPSPQKNGIQKRMEVGRSTFGKDYIMNGNLPLPEEVQLMYFANPKLQFRNLALHKIFREQRNAQRGMERKVLKMFY